MKGVHFKWSFFVNALRATAMQVMHCSTDINALRAMVSRREIISVEKATHIPAFVRRTLTGDNLKCTQPICVICGKND
jgi:hypothetical protein